MMALLTEEALVLVENTMATNETVPDFSSHNSFIAAFYIFISAFGILGNVLVIAGVAVSPKLRTPTNVLIVNLAIADLLTCMVLPFQTIGVLSPENEYPLPGYVCTIIGSVIYVTFTCSATTLTLISISRCYVITNNLRGPVGLNTHKCQISLAILAWILAFIYIYVPIYVFKLTDFAYYPSYKQCFTRPTLTSDLYHNVLSMLIGAHLVIMMGCYARIVVHVRQQRKLFRVFFSSKVNKNGHSYQHRKRLSRRELRVTVNLFIIVVAFICCTLPTAVAFALPGVLLFGIYSTAVLYFNNCINPVLYAFKHPVYKKLFRRLVSRVLTVVCCRGAMPSEDPPKSVSTACVFAMTVSNVVMGHADCGSMDSLDYL